MIVGMKNRVELNITRWVVIIIAFVISSCGQKENPPKLVPQQPEQVANQYKLGDNTIEVNKVAGKGKIKSFNTVPVYSVVDGIITKMSLIEGQHVRKNDVLAVIDDSECRLQLSELKSELQKNAYEVNSTLIGMGYTRSNLDAVPAKERETVEIMTGYSHTKVKYENQKQMLGKHIIRAPFDGSVLDLKVNKLFYARKGEPLFYLMDTENLIVQFEVLETMISSYHIGMPLEFTTLSFGNKRYRAKLLSIAPNVESSGMVVMTARVEGRHSELRPGMTTFVNIKEKD